MKNKISTLVLLFVILIPQVASASWWNPFSWKIFHRVDTKTQTLENRIQELENKLQTTPAPKESTTKTTSPTKASDGEKTTPVIEKTVASPVVTKTPPVVVKDMSVEIGLKNKIIGILDQQISTIEKFNVFIIADINYMDSVRSALLGYTGKLQVAIVNYTDVRLAESKKMLNLNAETLKTMYADKNSLQSQPLSYFSNYQIPKEYYDMSDMLPGVISHYVDGYNDYNDGISASINTMNQTQQQISNRKHCSFQGVSESMVIMDCY